MNGSNPLRIPDTFLFAFSFTETKQRQFLKTAYEIGLQTTGVAKEFIVQSGSFQ